MSAGTVVRYWNVPEVVTLRKMRKPVSLSETSSHAKVMARSPTLTTRGFLGVAARVGVSTPYSLDQSEAPAAFRARTR